MSRTVAEMALAQGPLPAFSHARWKLLVGWLSDRAKHLAGTSRARGNATVEQWITPHPNGRDASNRTAFRKFSLQVATLESTIGRMD
jgi:hypothetical protein